MSKPTPGFEPATHEPAARFWLRALAFVVVLAWIVGAPFYRQGLDGKNKHARAWIMFSGIALNAVDARFYQRKPDGTDVLLDRYAVLGMKRPSTPRSRHVRGKHGTWGISKQLCQKLGPGADIRVDSRRATRTGWVVDYDLSENLCKAPAPKRKRRRPGKRKGGIL
jgi:hypothetical protein